MPEETDPYAALTSLYNDNVKGAMGFSLTDIDAADIGDVIKAFDYLHLDPDGKVQEFDRKTKRLYQSGLEAVLKEHLGDSGNLHGHDDASGAVDSLLRDVLAHTLEHYGTIHGVDMSGQIAVAKGDVDDYQTFQQIISQVFGGGQPTDWKKIKSIYKKILTKKETDIYALFGPEGNPQAYSDLFGAAQHYAAGDVDKFKATVEGRLKAAKTDELSAVKDYTRGVAEKTYAQRDGLDAVVLKKDFKVEDGINLVKSLYSKGVAGGQDHEHLFTGGYDVIQGYVNPHE